jgi:hypothetical protein
MTNSLRGKILTDGKVRQRVLSDFVGKKENQEEKVRFVLLANLKKKGKISGYELDEVLGEGDNLQLVNPQPVSTKEFKQAFEEATRQGDDEETQTI